MPTPDPAPKKKGALVLVKKVLKVIFFPFLFMVNPKIYLDDDERDRSD
jgi:hypothetical protein